MEPHARLEQRRAAAAAEEERERRRANDQRQLEWLIESGLSVARRETRLWHIVDQARALRDAEEQLREEVRADWGYPQVEALVTEILLEFEECNESDEVVDVLDDEEGEDDDED